MLSVLIATFVTPSVTRSKRFRHPQAKGGPALNIEAECRSPYEADIEEQRLIHRYAKLYPILNLLHNSKRTQIRPFSKLYLRRVL